MAFKFFNAPTSVAYANEQEKNLVQALADLGIQRLYQAHTASFVGNNVNHMKGHNKMFAGFEATQTYAEDNETVLGGMLKYACESAGISYDEQTIKSLAHRKNTTFSERFFGIVDQALPVVIASTVNYAFMAVAETKHVGWGDMAHFIVPSKDIFYVNSLGLGNKHGAIQRVYSQDVVVNPVMKEVTVGLDWYQIATGKYDMGDFLYRVGLSYATDISKLAYNKIDASYSSLPANLQVAGFSDNNWIDLSARVKAGNAGLKVVAMGTLHALQSVLPTNDFLKMELGEELASVGFLTRYKQVDILEIPQVLVPGTVNTTLTFGLDDTRVYFFGTGDKPVKICFEGQAITSQTDMTESADGQMVITVKQKYDASVATSGIYGILDIG